MAHVDVQPPPADDPAQQLAAIRAELDAARLAYVAKLEKATSTAERDQLMKEAPSPEPFTERAVQVASSIPRIRRRSRPCCG